MKLANTAFALGRRLFFFLSVMLILSFGTAVSGHAEVIVVKGNSRVDVTTIQSYVSGQSIDVAKKDLLATGLFSSVDIAKKGEEIVVTVKENNIINRVAFEGTKRLKLSLIHI